MRAPAVRAIVALKPTGMVPALYNYRGDVEPETENQRAPVMRAKVFVEPMTCCPHLTLGRVLH